MTSTILAPNIRPIHGTYTGTTGVSTFQLPTVDYKDYILCRGHDVIGLLCQGANTLTTSASNVTITANGNYNFTISGLSWYLTPWLIPGNGF